jgi:hypothetical protein
MSAMRTQALPKLLQDQRQHQQRDAAVSTKAISLFFSWQGAPWLQARSATRSPSRPEGRSVSTMISTMKAKDVGVVAAQQPAGQVPM